MALKVITAPAAEPVTAADIYSKIGLKSGDVVEADITMMIATARQWAEEYTARAFVNRTLELALDEFPQREIELPTPPVTSITSIKYLDAGGTEQTMDSADFVLDDYGMVNWLLPAYATEWPNTLDSANAVKVRYVAGYGADGTSVPAAIKQAIVLIVGQAFRATPGMESGLYPAMIPNAAKELLSHYRIVKLY
jgi:uncharacterized phiE125 gp8 family phage protein